ncbi:MAG: type 1 glutamine amidotransferase [Candidatus Omnitrophota bacterium]
MGEFFKNTAWQLQTVELGDGGELPSSPREAEAIILLGGPMNVYQQAQYPFLKEENEFLKEALSQEIPILGVCLGAQLLAKASCASVKKSPEKEIGWRCVDLTEEGKKDLLFSGVSPKPLVFQWHQDTFDIPAGAALLARGAGCVNQAFRIGRRAYGLQFHIEVTPWMLESWVDAYKEEAAGIEVTKMIVEAYKNNEEFSRQAGVLYLNFARIIEAAAGVAAG